MASSTRLIQVSFPPPDILPPFPAWNKSWLPPLGDKGTHLQVHPRTHGWAPWSQAWALSSLCQPWPLHSVHCGQSLLANGLSCWVRGRQYPVFLPGESHGQRSLAGYSPWGCKSWTWPSGETTTTNIQGPQDRSGNSDAMNWASVHPAAPCVLKKEALVLQTHDAARGCPTACCSSPCSGLPPVAPSMLRSPQTSALRRNRESWGAFVHYFLSWGLLSHHPDPFSASSNSPFSSLLKMTRKLGTTSFLNVLDYELNSLDYVSS